MSWLKSNAESVEAMAACVTALVAVAALVGVKFQLDENERIQRATTAREAYLGHLNLATSKPELAAPQDVCGLLSSDNSASYTSFLDHLFYSAELMLEAEDGWQPVFMDHLEPHAPLMCSSFAPTGDTAAMMQMISTFQASECDGVQVCIGSE